jgi:hypothetical protein
LVAPTPAGGKLAKAEQGQLRFRLPVGLVYDPTGRVVLDPEQEVAEAVRLVFAWFEQHGSALAVVTHFAQHHLRFPTRLWGGGHDGELVWGRLTSGRAPDQFGPVAFAFQALRQCRAVGL